jgi:hypothetical protein
MPQPSLPPLAVWLLKRGVAGPNAESLAGDLIERYGRGRSRTWMWRQVFFAVAASILADVRQHKLLAVRAALTGIVAASILRFLLFWIAQTPVGSLVEAFTRESRHIFFGTWAPLLTMTGAGWLVGRLHRGHALPMVLTFAVVILIANIPELDRRVTNALIDARYRAAFRELLIAQSLGTCGILFGGLLSALGDGEPT